MSILTRSSLERGRVWLLPHKCQLYQAPDHCRKTERSTMVRYEIGCPRSRPFLYALPGGSKLTHLTGWTLPSKGLMTETHMQKTAASFGWLTSKDVRKGL